MSAKEIKVKHLLEASSVKRIDNATIAKMAEVSELSLLYTLK
jgi:hypothetical protein